MAELLVRIVDKINDDFYLNCQCTKRGDVIAIQADGAVWGTDELTMPFWQIVRLPGIDPSDLSALLQPELDTDPTQPSKTLQLRAFTFDLDSVAAQQPVNEVSVDDPTAGVLGDVVLQTVGGPTRAAMVSANQNTPAAYTPDLTPRTALATECAIDLQTVQGYIVAKPPITDPNVIGPSPMVIG